MYNRYIHNDCGSYAPIPEESRQESPHQENSAGCGFSGTFRALLDRFHLDSIDSGDLLLLGLLFFLYREGADEELLVALGLLLIL